MSGSGRDADLAGGGRVGETAFPGSVVKLKEGKPCWMEPKGGAEQAAILARSWGRCPVYRGRGRQRVLRVRDGSAHEKRREEEWERTKPGTAGRTRDQAGEKGAAGRARAICSANGDLGNEPAQLRQDEVGWGG